jgi:hypothetical protein
MSEALWSQLITAISTLAGVFFTLLFTNIQQRREDRRWKAGHYIQGRINAITQFATEIYKLDEIAVLTNPSSDTVLLDTDVLLQSGTELMEQVKHYAHAGSFARIYLPEAVQTQMVTTGQAAINLSRTLREVRSNPGNPLGPQLIKQYVELARDELYNLIDYLAAELNPTDLRQFHSPRRTLASLWPSKRKR